jgi:ribonuclease HII
VIPGLDDSKKLTPAARNALYDIIVRSAVSYGVASASEAEIDAVNILNATYLAMNRAIAQLDPLAELALVDGNRAGGIGYINRCIVGGVG